MTRPLPPAAKPSRQRQLGRRGFLVSGAAALSLAALGGRLLYVQGFDPGGIAEAARLERTRFQTVPALRGQILDVKGNILARSVQRYNITVDQSAVAEFERFVPNTNTRETVTPTQLVYELADILSMKDSDVKAALDGTSQYKVIKENVTPEVYDAIADLGATFVYGEILSERLYPNGQVAGSVVGRLSKVEEAVEGSPGQTNLVDYSVGIERSLGAELAGEDGERVYEISADGVRIPVGEEQVKPAVNGKNVRLTIDQDIQYFAQQIIKARVKEKEAEWGTVVVMKVKDASILALADSSTMDPGAEKFNLEDMTPRAITQAVEPGSTEKILTASAVLELGLADPLTTFDVPAQLEIDGQTFKDAFSHPAQKRTFSGIITDSMNTGTILAGRKMTKEQRYDWLKKYGLGELTGVELTGESQGLVPDYKDWDVRQQYTVLFGQGLTQTPLQTALIYQTLANKGVKLQPRIVDAIIDENGDEQVRPLAEGQRLVSEQTAQQALDLLENVVLQNAKEAQVSGYRVGGKTGTAEAPSQNAAGYDGYTTSFVGIAPLEDPQFLVSVTLQRPKTDAASVGTAGTTAQFSQIMEKVLHTYKVPYSTSSPHEIPKFPDGHDESG